MILYFADRTMQILGMASTDLQDSVRLTDDSVSDDVESGVTSLEVTVLWADRESRNDVESWTAPGNYVIYNADTETKFFTVIDRERNFVERTALIYAEDGGLDLLNATVGEFEATEAHDIAWYINKYIADTGFEIGVNDCPSITRTLSWDGEQTVTERLASIATQFDNCEIAYSFEFHGLMVTHKYVNIYEQRGRDTSERLRIGKEVRSIVAKESVADLATALYCTGGTKSGEDKPITLSGYSYDDGDIYVSGKLLKCRSALAKWSRLAWETADKGDDGHIVKQYSYDTKNQATLCRHAVTKLKKIAQVVNTYEVELNYLPDGMGVGDRCIILDEFGDFHANVRLQTLKKSRSGHTWDAEFEEIPEVS